MIILVGMLFSPLSVLTESAPVGETNEGAVETGEHASGGEGFDQSDSFSAPSDNESSGSEVTVTKGSGNGADNSIAMNSSLADRPRE